MTRTPIRAGVERMLLLAVFFVTSFSLFAIPLPTGRAKSALDAGADYAGIDRRIAYAVAFYESSYRLNARSCVAHGLMQIHERYGDYLSERFAPGCDYRTPEGNACIGCAYIKWLWNRAGSLDRALVWYNQGLNCASDKPGAVLYSARIQQAIGEMLGIGFECATLELDAIAYNPIPYRDQVLFADISDRRLT